MIQDKLQMEKVSDGQSDRQTDRQTDLYSFGYAIRNETMETMNGGVEKGWAIIGSITRRCQGHEVVKVTKRSRSN